MRRTARATVTITALGLLAVAVGCNPERAAPPPTAPAPPKPTAFFTQLAAEPGAGTLQGQLKATFPDLGVHVGGGGGNVASAPGQPLMPTVLVQIVAGNG